MKTTFEILLTSRKVLFNFLEHNSVDKLNTIPEGYSNNLIWNIGHIIVVQQLLIYKLSGLPLMISDRMVAKYKKGTKPEEMVSQEEINEMKSLLFSTVEQTKLDFSNKIFKTYSEFTSMTGYTMTNAKEALEFNNYHEGLHLGIMMQIKKFI
ncbi:MAG: DinB family protein [Flavobacterium sp.]|uniref:DinB family protein n=1 Tax=Flavobacterium sp. TaxID=239 RepID=UPI0035299C9F